MEHIKTGGLMTRKERDSQQITVARNNGSFFGDGVYTGNNPIAFTRYGTVGLLVARLKGRSRRIPHKRLIFHQLAPDRTFDTVIGNKSSNRSHDEVVLADSSQCLPIVKFPTSMIARSLGQNGANNPMVKIHIEIQQVVEEFFNGRLSEQVMRNRNN